MLKVWNILKACLVEMKLGTMKKDKLDNMGRPYLVETSIELDKTSLLQAHIWVLHNIDEIQPWIE